MRCDARRAQALHWAGQIEGETGGDEQSPAMCRARSFWVGRRGGTKKRKTRGQHAEHDDRSANFHIYLPEWLARYNKQIFGPLYVAGVAYGVVRYLGAA
jgi:hypothetical protein